jgi:hypothetical protein
MALSDACGDFLSMLSEGNGAPKDAVRWLVKEVNGYDGEPWNYDRGEIPALREACNDFLASPAGASASRAVWLGALVRLVVLAEQTRAYHDTPPDAAERLSARALH